MKIKIYKYDFLVVGAGLIGSLAALQLIKKNYKVLVIDKNNKVFKDQRTLAVNANSKDFLKGLNLWKKLKTQPEHIQKIIIKDDINSSPLVFQNPSEEMGSVILNRELLLESLKELEKTNSIIKGVNIPLKKIRPNELISINDRKYSFRNIVLSFGKKFQEDAILKKFTFSKDVKANVGFFKHSIKHNQIAYEVFTSDGPLAVLPAPNKSKKESTFIYSSKKSVSTDNLHKLINRYFNETHGTINFHNKISKFEIIPHLSKDKLNKYFLIGDSLRSIHPVAGQGWNLGIKDIQCLSNLLETHDLEDPSLVKKFYSQRNVENISYLSFTSSLNILYENQNILTNSIIKSGFKVLRNFDFLRSAFIKQAMGR